MKEVNSSELSIMRFRNFKINKKYKKSIFYYNQ